MTTQRGLELLLGMALVGYAVYAVVTGTLQGKFRRYRRSEDPFSYWFGVLITAGIGLVCLVGTAAWRR